LNGSLKWQSEKVVVGYWGMRCGFWMIDFEEELQSLKGAKFQSSRELK